MKKCRQCSKPATLHITEIRDGEAQAIHFCETCAQDYIGTFEGGDTGAQDSLSEKLEELSSAEELAELDRLVCPNCGITFGEFRSQGRLGCPHDYDVFADELVPLLENIHNETKHCGKFPKRSPEVNVGHYELIRLRNDLRLAVEREEYEAAAGLRDRIQSLESEVQVESERPDREAAP